jgi:hypothetical protein
MGEEIKIWKIEGELLREELEKIPLDMEKAIENWIMKDIKILSENLIIIGNQIQTSPGGIIDVLCMDQNGDIVIVELKRDKTPRDVTSQVLDYASWVNDLTAEEILDLCKQKYGSIDKFKEEFEKRFEELPDSINENHRMIIVGSLIDSTTERIVKYLSEKHNIDINIATFNFFKSRDDQRFLARVFMVEPEDGDGPPGTKRLPNLTFEELEKQANENQVLDIYKYATDKLLEIFTKQRTRTTIAFGYEYEGRHVVISLSPKMSEKTKGLYFYVYLHRLMKFFDINEEGARSILPKSAVETRNYEKRNEKRIEFEGYFSKNEEIDLFCKSILNQMK